MSGNVEVAGAQIVKTYGEKMLVKVGKVHMNNTKRIKELLKKD